MHDDQLSLAYDMNSRLYNRLSTMSKSTTDCLLWANISWYNICNNNVKSNLVIVNGGHRSLKPHRHRQQKIPHHCNNNKHITYLDDDQMEE